MAEAVELENDVTDSWKYDVIACSCYDVRLAAGLKWLALFVD